MLVARTVPLSSTMSARWAWIGSAGMPPRGSTGTAAESSAMRPAMVEKPRMKATPRRRSRVSALARSARWRCASRAARSSASTRFGSLALGTGAQDAGERAQRTADHC